ncbi:hypothetical protein GM3708_3056 [Geminocystis sp. NIES-3708]|uniref:hypothetical protein n=1 Tax=Geminocystis sp. NIES-3708 TaxID=1615909 RepID=UPI0005FCBFE8|nr:hypothetical protein [Geminocystis sp. NIES-3708]BAQ62650.1 hypothetical protein GM3708_3056 [Geminocystis sp. NIES-3708]
MNKRIAYYFLISFILLGITTIYSESYVSFLPSILLQELVITGWFFVWEAVSLIFFDSLDFYHRYRTYKRLYNALIIFKEQK